jgi:hypothetical protein
MGTFFVSRYRLTDLIEHRLKYSCSYNNVDLESWQIFYFTFTTHISLVDWFLI